MLRAHNTSKMTRRNTRSPHHPSHRAMLIGSLLALPLLLSCERDASQPPEQSPALQQPQEPASRYRDVDGSRIILLPAIDDNEALAAAIEEARATLPEARTRWAAQPTTDRVRWALKWSAQTLDGDIEHLWVRPTAWSEHRIEGLLLSKPTTELLDARQLGDLISFTPDQVSDWICFTDTVEGTYEGGYTLQWIEEQTDK